MDPSIHKRCAKKKKVYCGVREDVALCSIVCGDDGRGSCVWPVGCFRAFVWHLSLSVVAAREHLWRSSLRGVDTAGCPVRGTPSCSKAGWRYSGEWWRLGYKGGGFGEWTNLRNVKVAQQPTFFINTLARDLSKEGRQKWCFEQFELLSFSPLKRTFFRDLQ